jgi:hypothetical protein
MIDIDIEIIDNHIDEMIKVKIKDTEIIISWEEMMFIVGRLREHIERTILRKIKKYEGAGE